jgi:two-component system, cell cycle response regulator DivK
MSEKRILVVEDDEASHYIFGAALEHHGFAVLKAWGAEQAVATARDHRPDLIIMDVGLPEVDGFEATRRFKSDPELGDIPVIIVTVHVFEKDRAAARAAGCDLFLEKPLEPRVLVAEVSRVLGLPGPQLPA